MHTNVNRSLICSCFIVWIVYKLAKHVHGANLRGSPTVLKFHTLCLKSEVNKMVIVCQ